jgi:anti-anti-sigma factor
MRLRAGQVPQSEQPEPADEACIRLSEELLVDGLADARWLLHDALVAGARRIVIDLGDVGPLSSAALASFLWAHRTCRARGGEVVLRGADRRTRAMLGRTGLERVLRLQTADGRVAA